MYRKRCVSLIAALPVPATVLAQDAVNPAKLPRNMEVGLFATAVYTSEVENFPNGTHICEVEVDPGTGKTSFENFVAVDDFGRLINPMIVEGQVHGGLVQGIGQCIRPEYTAARDRARSRGP